MDLAGSERQKQAGTVGDRFKEGSLINKSLMVLANVINSLVDISEGKSRFVHYRDSKLTFLLKDSLGGNSKTSIIANISPASTAYGETLSTLKFAQRAKLIKNKVHINENASGTLEGLKGEIFRLRQELANMRNLINIGGIRYSEEKRDFNKSIFEIGPISQADPNLVQEDLPWNSDEQDTRDSQKSHELEALLKQSLDILTESETHLLNELSKKDDIIERMRNTHEMTDKSELQMKMVIKLMADKIDRLKSMLEKKVLSEEDCLQVLEGERRNNLKEQLLRILRDPQLDIARIKARDLTELRDENNRLKEEYLHLMDVIMEKEDKIIQLNAESQSKESTEAKAQEAVQMDVEARAAEESVAREELLQSREDFNKIKAEYEVLMGECTKMTGDFEQKNNEIQFLKGVVENYEAEKKTLVEEVETLSRDLEAKVKQEYDEKLSKFIKEQEDMVDQFRQDFLRVKHERDTFEKDNLTVAEQIREIEGKNSVLVIEKDELIAAVENLKASEIRLESEGQEKIAEFIKLEEVRLKETEHIANEVLKMQEQMKAVLTTNEVIKEDNERLKQELETLNLAYNEKSENYQNLEKNYEMVQEANVKREQTIQEAQVLCESLQEQDTERLNELDRIRSECDTLKFQVEDQDQKLLVLAEQYQGAVQVSEVKAQQIESLERDHAELQRNYSAKEAESLKFKAAYEELEVKCLLLEKESASSSECIESLTRENVSKVQENEHLHSKLAEINENYSIKEKGLDLFKEENMKLSESNGLVSQELKATREKLENLEMEYQAKDQEAASSNVQIQNLEQECLRISHELDAVTKDYETFRRSSLEKDQMTGNLEAHLHEIQSKSRIQEQEFTSLQEEYDTLTQTCLAREQEVSDLLKTQSDLNNQLSSQATQLQSLIREREQLEENLSQKEERLVSVNQKYEEASGESQSLSQQLHSLQQELELLNKAYATKGTELTTLSERHEDLRREFAKKEENLADLIKQYEDLSDDSNRKYEDVSRESQIFSQQLHSLQQEFELLNTAYAAKTTEVTTLSETHEDLRRELTKKEESLTDLIKQYEDLSDASLQKDEEYQLLKTENDAFKQDIEDISHLHKSLKAEYELLKKEYTDRKNDYDVLEKHTNELSLRCNDLETQKTSQEEELTTMRQEFNDLQSDRAAIKQAREQHQKNETTLKEQVELYLQTLEQLKLDHGHQVLYLKEDLEKSRQEKDALVNKQASLNQEITDKGVHVTNMEQEVVSLRREILGKDQEAESRTREMNQKQMDFTQRIAELEEKEKQMVKYKEEVDRFTEEHQVLLAERAFFEKAESSLRQEINQLSEKLNKLTHEREESVIKLKENYKNLQRECSELNDAVLNREEEIASLKAKYEKAEKERETISKDLKDKKRKEAQLLEENQQYCEDMANLENQWRSAYQDSESNNLNLSTEITKLKEELASKAQETAKMRDEYKGSSKEKENLARTIHSYESAHAEWLKEKEKVSYLEASKKEYEKKLKDMRDLHSKFSKEIESTRNELFTREKDVLKLRGEVDKLVNEKTHLLNEIAEYKEIEVKMGEEIQSYSDKLAAVYGEQEKEMSEVKDQYIKLTQEHKTLMRTIALKDDQLGKLREEAQSVFTERDRLQQEIDSYRALEGKLRNENQELYEKVSRLNSDQYLLLKEIDNLNKANDTLGGHKYLYMPIYL